MIEFTDSTGTFFAVMGGSSMLVTYDATLKNYSRITETYVQRVKIYVYLVMS